MTKSFSKDSILQDMKNSLSKVGILITSIMQIKKTDQHVPVKIPKKIFVETQKHTSLRNIGRKL